jgi:hypothetical protein
MINRPVTRLMCMAVLFGGAALLTTPALLRAMAAVVSTPTIGAPSSSGV